MEPGEIDVPNFKFEFKEGLVLNWRHIIDEINIPEILTGQGIDSLVASHLNFAYADIVSDPCKSLFILNLIFSFHFYPRPRCTKSNNSHSTWYLVSALYEVMQY